MTRSPSSAVAARAGSRAPQARNVPPYATSAGPEAIELARAAGLTLDGWQGDFLTDALGEDEAGKWTAFENGLIVSRQNGKGSVLEARVLAGLNLFGERMILWSAHETKTAFEAFRRCETLFTEVDELRKQVKAIHRSNGSEGIELRSGARLRFVARTKGSGRGFSADLVILDEAYALTGDQMSALIPTLASRPNPQIWYTSSPPLDGITGEQLYALRARALKGDGTLCWYDWGVQGVDLEDLDDVDLDDWTLWSGTNPAYNIRISEAFVARERATLPAVDFARERLGIWPRKVEEGSGVIDLELWRDLATTAAEAGRPETVMFAVVVEADRSRTAIAAVGAQDDGRVQLAIVAYDPGTEWVVDRMVQLRERWSPALWVIEDKGATASLWPELERAGFKPPEDRDEPKRGDVAVPYAGDVAAAYGLFHDRLTERRIAHLADRPLDAAVTVAETRPLGSGTTWDHRAQVAALRAVTNGLWGWETHADKVLAVRDELGIW